MRKMVSLSRVQGSWAHSEQGGRPGTRQAGLVVFLF